VVLHPTDPNTLWVAVLGHLYSPNTERGVYKTIDGGKNWVRTLFVNENSGGIDLVVDPNDPNMVMAATWERSRSAWNFTGAGEGSAIWKSIDGGSTWAKSVNGFPSGAKTGRIGLSAGKKNGKTVWYACLDNQNAKPAKEKSTDDALTKDQLRGISKADFLQLSDEKLGAFLKQNGFPEQYNAKKVTGLVEKDLSLLRWWSIWKTPTVICLKRILSAQNYTVPKMVAKPGNAPMRSPSNRCTLLMGIISPTYVVLQIMPMKSI
jgi:hypothetical protein